MHAHAHSHAHTRRFPITIAVPRQPMLVHPAERAGCCSGQAELRALATLHGACAESGLHAPRDGRRSKLPGPAPTAALSSMLGADAHRLRLQAELHELEREIAFHESRAAGVSGNAAAAPALPGAASATAASARDGRPGESQLGPSGWASVPSALRGQAGDPAAEANASALLGALALDPRRAVFAHPLDALPAGEARKLRGPGAGGHPAGSASSFSAGGTLAQHSLPSQAQRGAADDAHPASWDAVDAELYMSLLQRAARPAGVQPGHI